MRMLLARSMVFVAFVPFVHKFEPDLSMSDFVIHLAGQAISLIGSFSRHLGRGASSGDTTWGNIA
jgi:hypothetical protein